MYRILIVEDDSTIAEALKRHLEGWDHETVIAEDFKNIMAEFTRVEPDLVLLDIGLPFYNGFYWCSQIRQVSDVPIIFISSASDNMNIVMAMNMGGDDFVAKPFDLEVLTAKIQALLRRAYDFAEQSPLLEHRGAQLDTGDGTLRYKGESIPLTKNEFRILLTLMENRGKVVSREKLMERLWATDSFVDENTLTVNVNRLRRKLEGAGLPDFIATKFGVGYMLAQDSEGGNKPCCT